MKVEKNRQKNENDNCFFSPKLNRFSITLNLICYTKKTRDILNTFIGTFFFFLSQKIILYKIIFSAEIVTPTKQKLYIYNSK